MELTSSDRARLKAQSHELKPTVLIGKEGITPTIIASVEENFNTRELVKIKLSRYCPVSRPEVTAELCRLTGAAPVQQIGHTILIYRKRETKES